MRSHTAFRNTRVCCVWSQSVCVLLGALGCAELMTLDTMTPQERMRQGYIQELIQTEETYLEDLELVLEVAHTHTHTLLLHTSG